MIAIIARLSVQAGKETDFEAAMAELAAAVRKNEAGCKLYQLCKTNVAGKYVMLERYETQEAFGVHGQTEYFRASLPKWGMMLAGRPEIEILTELD
jgi:quinol monooxygenase YgiN